MSALYGRLRPYGPELRSRPEVTRQAHSAIEAQLETWEGAVAVELRADGSYEVRVGTKRNPARVIARGNIDTTKGVAA